MMTVLFRVRGKRLRCLLTTIPFLLLLAASVCDARTFRVLDVSTDQPLPEVRVKLRAFVLMPSIGHPAEVTVGRWEGMTDQNGEFSIISPWASRAYVNSLTKRGYTDIATTKGDHAATHLNTEKLTILYLTPQEDAVYEQIRFDAMASIRHVSLSAPGQLPSPLYLAAGLYQTGKRKARTERERQALKDFCPLAPRMRELLQGPPDPWAGKDDVENARQMVAGCE